MKNKHTQNGRNNATDIVELEKGTEHIIVEIVEYVPNAVMSRTIIKKSTGNVTAMSFSEGEELCEKIIPFDNYIQVIDGVASLTIGKEKFHLKVGSGITIPAHAVQCFYADEQFKIISTIIKSGYED
ncbi:MAG TPA: cupin domain-containing protein [Phnomibacter sp.]|nr:cupin domain-containing protein [Phnomibacter sp.]